MPGQRPGPGHYQVGLKGEITAPQYWAPHFHTAYHSDLAERRHREALAGGQAPTG